MPAVNPPAHTPERPPERRPDRTRERPARVTCPRCGRPQRTCLCSWIRPTDNQLPLLVLQHPLEQHQAKGSARLLALSLQQCRCEVGEVFDPQALASWLGAPAAGSSLPLSPLLLYPLATGETSGAAPLPSLPLPVPAGWRLVLIDGTWRQTRRLLRANPLLQQLPRWPLPAPPPSRYAIRKAQRPAQRSTLEAACQALAALEGRAAAYGALLAAFDGWVAEQGRWAAAATAEV